ncbi:MAG: ribbon-helix-helix protein, CopG family [Actinomycetota bacterium]
MSGDILRHHQTTRVVFEARRSGMEGERKPTSGNPRVLVAMPVELHDELQKQATREDRPVARIVREAIRRYLAQPRDSMATEA